MEKKLKKSVIYCALVWGGSLLFSFLCLGFLLLSGLVNVVTFVEWEFFSGCGLSLSVMVLMDFLGVIFSFVVCLISGCVFLYSVSYMEADKFVNLFCSLVACFVWAMNILIYIPHLAFMLLGWDLLGIVSFLLVIYYQNSVSVGAGMLTILVNRLGDVFLLLSISLVSVTGTWGILSYSSYTSNYVVVIVSVLLVSACLTKSAQMPFSVWLPAAMAAPTPVSALVHSSTLVTAGVYVMFRYYSFFSAVDGLLLVTSKVGCLTLLMASLAACFEMDIKKLIALSTLGHLGFMIYVLGLGYPVLSFFHMVMHALFKSLLFLCAGCYIHMSGSSQDVRQLSGIGWMSSPLLVSCSIIGFSSLCGVPYLSGFYSKDAILESSFGSFNGVIEMLCILLSASISYVYSMRILLKAVFGVFGGISLVEISFGSWFMWVPICLLTIGSVIFGFLLQVFWVESCQTFVVSEILKLCLFFVLNMGNFVMVLEKISYGAFGRVETFAKCYVIFMSVCTSMWLLRWVFFWMPTMLYNIAWKAMTVLESGWMEMLGGHLVFLTFSFVSIKLWVLERISVLAILRFSSMFLLVVVFFFSM
uniref:NADH-ubiquinone oxidoreductase chain 5 n=1 Tax=Unio pictorum TaxID=55837 RepID=A0A346HGW1_UNIPI|nr:NADH dehydrogenase subunit 5 [Unio pictorum]AXO78647.1 NADH dehydrogenase subunit 5 [Unio pictorum]